MQIQLSLSKNFDALTSTERAAFNRWFGKSVVVGDDLKPLRVYHGTGYDIKRFERKYFATGINMFGAGFYFTDSPEAASIYAKYKERAEADAEAEERASGSNITPVYLRITKPVYPENLTDHATLSQVRELLSVMRPDLRASVVSALTGCDLDEAEDSIKALVGSSLYAILVMVLAKVKDIVRHYGRPEPAHGTFNSKMVSKFQKLTGHDGIIVEPKEAGTGKYYIVFSSTQIKSAVGNSGRYRRSNDITD